MSGLRGKPWLHQPDDAARQFHARYVPHQPVTMADVWRMTAGPTARFLARHARAIVAAAKAYWSVVK